MMHGYTFLVPINQRKLKKLSKEHKVTGFFNKMLIFFFYIIFLIVKSPSPFNGFKFEQKFIMLLLICCHGALFHYSIVIFDMLLTHEKEKYMETEIYYRLQEKLESTLMNSRSIV